MEKPKLKQLIREKIKNILNEALPISKAKELYLIQKSDKVIQYQDKIFNELKNTSEYIKSNKTGDRLYFRFNMEKNEKNNTYKPNLEIIKTLQDNNFKIKDYIKGIATDKYNREVKIGKILQKTNPELLQKFNNDINREASKDKNQLIVISKNPYDIGGASTDRGWNSCMNLYTGKNAQYINCDIKQGTIIAYLVNMDDLNINNPQARIFIKPFINIKDKNDIIYYPERVVYGTSPKSFEVFINEIFKKYYPKSGMYSLTPGLYADDAGENEERLIDFKSIESSNRDEQIGKKIIKNIILSKDELNVDNLILVNKNIESLPDNLNIKNLLSLANNPNLKNLPNNIKIGGNLWLSNTGIENLPKNLKINGDISLNNTPLAKKYNNNPNEIRKIYPNIKGRIIT
jgi:hypothetical protein